MLAQVGQTEVAVRTSLTDRLAAARKRLAEMKPLQGEVVESE